MTKPQQPPRAASNGDNNPPPPTGSNSSNSNLPTKPVNEVGFSKSRLPEKLRNKSSVIAQSGVPTGPSAERTLASPSPQQIPTGPTASNTTRHISRSTATPITPSDPSQRPSSSHPATARPLPRSSSSSSASSTNASPAPTPVPTNKPQRTPTPSLTPLPVPGSSNSRNSNQQGKDIVAANGSEKNLKTSAQGQTKKGAESVLPKTGGGASSNAVDLKGKGKEKEVVVDDGEEAMELDGQSELGDSIPGRNLAEKEEDMETKALRFVKLCADALARDPSDSKSQESQNLDESLVSLFGLLNSRLKPPPTETPPPRTVTFSALEELEKRMNEKMEKLEKERDETIEVLKEEAKVDREKREILEHRIAGLKLEFQAAERKRSDQSQAQFKKPTIDAQIDERVKPLKKTITEAVTSIVKGDVEERINQITAQFEDRVTSIDHGFREWWAVEADSWSSVQVGPLHQRLAALEKRILSSAQSPLPSSIPSGPRSQNNQHSAPSTDPRLKANSLQTSLGRSTPNSSAPNSATSPSSSSSALSRLPPTGPSANRPPTGPSSSRLPTHAHSAPNASPLHSSLPSPIEPSTVSSASPAPAAPAPEYVTLAQLHASREKSVNELRNFEARCWQEVGKLKKQVDRLSSRPIEQGSPSGSPTESPKKNARLSEGDERPSKRAKVTNGAVPVESTSTAEETQATNEAIAKISELENAVSTLKQALQAAQGEIAKFTKLESSISDLEERTVKVEGDRQEFLKRMADGDKSTGRKAEVELKKTNTRMDQHLKEYKTLETNLNKKFSELEASSTEQNVRSFSDEPEEEWEEKIQSLRSDWTSLKKELAEITNRQRTDQVSNESAFDNVRESLAAKVDQQSLTRRLASKVDEDALLVKLESKVDQVAHRRDIANLNKTIADVKVLTSQEVLTLIDNAFVSKNFDEILQKVGVLRSDLVDLQQTISKLETRQNQGFKGCSTAFAETRSEIQQIIQNLQALSDAVSQVDAGARLATLESNSSSIADTLGESKNEIERLKRSGIAATNEHRELRERFSAHLTSLEAIRSKPTPPVSPTLPASSISHPSTSHSGRPPQLDLAQKEELASVVLQSIKHNIGANIGAAVESKVTEIQATIENQVDTRVGSVSSTITSLQELLSTVRRLGENTDDSFKEHKKKSESRTDDLHNRLLMLESGLSALAPTINYIVVCLGKIEQEAGGGAGGRNQLTQLNQSQASSSRAQIPMSSNAQALPQAHVQQSQVQGQAQAQMQMAQQRPTRPRQSDPNLRPSSAGQDQYFQMQQQQQKQQQYSNAPRQMQNSAPPSSHHNQQGSFGSWNGPSFVHNPSSSTNR
ncbi:hypothetical protein JCM3765_005595 [Sporobolomyces pararoseus]